MPLRIYLISAADWNQLTDSSILQGFMYPRGLGFTAVLNAQSWAKETILLFHEYTHFMLRHATTTSYPRWYDEGFADFLSTFEYARGKSKVGMPSVDRLHSLAMFGQARWVPLRTVLEAKTTFLSDDGKESHSEELGFYAESWALVHYLVFEAPDGHRGLQEYLRLRSTNVSIDDAFSRAFKMTVAEMEDSLKKYVRRKRFNFLNWEIAPAAMPSFGELKVRAMSTSETALELSKIIARVKPDNLLPYAEKVVKADGANLVALAGKANALTLDGQFAAGRSLLQRVLASNPTDPEILLIAGDIYSIEAALRTDATDAERNDLRRMHFESYHEALKEPYVGYEDLEIIVRHAIRALEYETGRERALMQIEHIRKLYAAEPTSAMIHARLLQALGRSAEAREPWSVAAEFARGINRITAIEELERLDVK
jgi:tetratricopeptide (TPR) repeat protein